MEIFPVKAVQSETAGKVMEIVNQTLDAQLQKLTPKKESK